MYSLNILYGEMGIIKNDLKFRPINNIISLNIIAVYDNHNDKWVKTVSIYYFKDTRPQYGEYIKFVSPLVSHRTTHLQASIV